MTGRRRASVWSPGPLAAVQAEDRHIEREMDAVVAALREHGPLGARELRRVTDARFWGPGRFGAALGRARREGRVRRDGLPASPRSDDPRHVATCAG
jgi:hypothetical protein